MTNFDPKRDLVDFAQREEAARLYMAWIEFSDLLEDARSGDDGVITQALEKAEMEAWDAYADHPLTLMDDGKGGLVRCAVSGVPLLDIDDTELVLRAAVKPALPEMETA